MVNQAHLPPVPWPLLEAQGWRGRGTWSSGGQGKGQHSALGFALWRGIAPAIDPLMAWAGSRLQRDPSLLACALGLNDTTPATFERRGWVEQLLVAGVPVDPFDSSDVNTPLRMACLANDAPTIRLLMAHGADPYRVNGVVRSDRLSEMMVHRHAEAFEALLEGGFARDPRGDAAMANLVSVDTLPQLRLFLAHGGNANWENSAGNTLLGRTGSPEVLQVLIEYGARLDHRNRQGQSMEHLIRQRDGAASKWLAAHHLETALDQTLKTPKSSARRPRL